MGPAAIVEGHIAADRGAGLADGLVSLQVDLLVLDRAPEPLDEDVVAPGASAVHADGDTGLEQHFGEGLAGELRSLVRVEDVRLAMPDHCLLQCLDGSVSAHARDAVTGRLTCRSILLRG